MRYDVIRFRNKNDLIREQRNMHSLELKVPVNAGDKHQFPVWL